MPTRKPWSRTIEQHGVRIRLFERSGVIYRDITLGRTTSANGKRRTLHDKKSLGHSDRKLAEQQAAALARELAKARLDAQSKPRRDATADTVRLGDLFRLYREHRLPSLKLDRQRYAGACIAMFLECWGEDQLVIDIGQAHVDRFVRMRRSGELVPPAHRPDGEGKRRPGYRAPTGVRDGTLHSNLTGWLSPCFNWAHRFKENGQRLLTANPLHDCELPVEKNKRRPIASERRYSATQDHTDAVDPAGRLRCILALARHTGRRESAICGLRAADVLLTTDRIVAVLAAEGLDERPAEHMPNGAIRWSEASDKQGLRFVTALSRDARAELDRYLAKNPRIGDAPLFPAPGDPEQPVSRYRAAEWLTRAERRAKLPKLERGAYHPYRRLWASERRHLPDVAVAAGGGWKDPATMKTSYQQPDPETLLKVIEGRM